MGLAVWRPVFRTTRGHKKALLLQPHSGSPRGHKSMQQLIRVQASDRWGSPGAGDLLIF